MTIPANSCKFPENSGFPSLTQSIAISTTAAIEFGVKLWLYTQDVGGSNPSSPGLHNLDLLPRIPIL